MEPSQTKDAIPLDQDAPDGANGLLALSRTEQEAVVLRALRYAVSRSAGFAAIALWCPWVIDSIDSGREYVACTDGRTIRFGPGFFAYPPLEQAGILVHEVLHVALRHIPRMRKGRYDPLLWNLCADAVINEAIRKLPAVELPSDGVYFDKLLTREELEQTPAHEWTTERLYAHLLSDKQRLLALFKQFVGDLVFVEGENGIFDIDDLPLGERVWNERLLRATACDKPGGLMRTLSQDFPHETIAWEKILRRLMTLPLMPQTKPNWNRPSRRTLALSNDFWEPGTRPRDGLNLAGVVVDTSGSIDDTLLTRFAGEIQAIQRRTGCDIYLVSADAAVQSEQIVRCDGRSFKDKVTGGKIAFKGGGGTDFYPALQCMKAKKVRVCVYLTDLIGNFGPEMNYPFSIIWATTTKDMTAPFGKTVYIRE